MIISDPDLDPDPTGQVISDPDPTGQVISDPDPTFQVITDPYPKNWFILQLKEIVS